MGNKIRVYHLAAELGMTTRELLELLEEEGIPVKSHASSLDEDVAGLVRDHVVSQRRLDQDEAGNESEIDSDSLDTEESSEPMAGAVSEAEGSAKTKEVHLKPPVKLRDLAEALDCKPNQLIGELMGMNIFATINQVLEPETAHNLCRKHGYEFIPEKREKSEKAERKKKISISSSKEPVSRGKTVGDKPRSPIVAFLGHVDHGKTSLLDRIRTTQVTVGESGGITQHIGASKVEWQGQMITFLDTPGHEAFTQMRLRGAMATDLLVLVVAADDGVMPQTVEAIKHARAAEVPIIVAMNKIDITDADPERVLIGLQQQEITPEEWGGQVGVVPVSAITGQGMDDLLERILLESELLELKADPEMPAEGVVIEAQLESGMGATASVVIRNGTLRNGDIVLCGDHYGRVKALLDEHGNRIPEAGPSCPVKILGLSGVPVAGDQLYMAGDEREAKAIAAARVGEKREEELSSRRGASLEDLFEQMSAGTRQELSLIIKADVQGSVEAIQENLGKLESNKIVLKIIHAGVGEVTENDILLAAASDAIVLGFHVRASNKVNKIAKQQGVEIRLYSIIYELLEDVKEAMIGRLEPELRESPLGKAEIREVFEVSKAGRICGSFVTEGSVRVGASARVLRQGDIIYNGQISSLRRFKEDAREVRAGFECGIRLDNFEDFEVGDIIEAFTVEKEVASL